MREESREALGRELAGIRPGYSEVDMRPETEQDPGTPLGSLEKEFFDVSGVI